MSTPQPPRQPTPESGAGFSAQPPFQGQPPQPAQGQHSQPQYGQPQYSQPQYVQQPDGTYAQAGYGAAQLPVQQPPQPPTKPRRPWILWVILAAVLVVVLVVVGGFFAVRALLGATSVAPPVDEVPTAAEDTPEYIETAAYIDGLIEKYYSENPDEQAEFFPNGRAGYDSTYMNDFMISLVETQVELEDLADLEVFESSGVFVSDVADLVLSVRTKAEGLERTFLAQESFGSKRLTLEDGTEYSSDGEYYPEGTPAYNAEREAFAQNFVGQPDANGSYAAAGEELAAGLGVTLNHNFREILDYCGSSDGSTETDTSTGAAYCDKSPGVVYINHDSVSYESDVHSPYYIQMIKHEFGHARIAGVCATTRPEIASTAGINSETLTNAFTVLYLGGDAALLQQVAVDRPEYLITEEANQLARGIHDNSACQ